MDNEKREFENIESEFFSETEVLEEENISEEIMDGETSYNDSDEDISDDPYKEHQYSEYNYDETVFNKADVTDLTEKPKTKKFDKIYFIAGSVVALVIVIFAWIFCVTNGVGSENLVNTKLPVFEEIGEIEQETDLDIKFENPIIGIINSKTPYVLRVGDYKVSDVIYDYFTDNLAINLEYSLYQTQTIKDIKNFDWKSIHEDSGLSYEEIIKGKTIEMLAPIVAVINQAQKNGITLTEDDINYINENIKAMKDAYGDEFENSLKNAGFDDENQFVECQKIQFLYQKAYEDYNSDPSKYLEDIKYTNDMSEITNDDKVSVKHILINFPEGVTNTSSDEEKNDAKVKAEDALLKAESGEDFDKLISQYNQDLGQPATGYTFANDGSMVQEFADASFGLEIGQISQLVETPYGYHIIKRIERTVDFEEYTEFITKHTSIKINSKYYKKKKVEVNLSEFLQAAQQSVSDQVASEE